MIKLFVATPCYGGQVHVEYMKSVMSLCTKNVSVTFYTIPFESLIPRARNVCAAAFYKSDCTHMIFIDADIAFNADDVIRMIEYDKNVICGAYPKKALNYANLKKNAQDSESLESLIASSVNYAVNFETQTAENGIVTVLDGATGFMILKKEVFRLIILACPEIEYKNDISAYSEHAIDGLFYDFFPSGREAETKRFLSEDYGFCRLWQSIGGEVYCDLKTNLTHIGQLSYIGCPALYFK